MEEIYMEQAKIFELQMEDQNPLGNGKGNGGLDGPGL